ncbi:carbohydrate ABC transporter permease [Jiangella alkaliphila]|uniref:Multiple sugar transport system permease protein n=1 Tax=Jiangella alkaliphila TaxID=419479 RepID=A0A1H2KEK4_9ACTN|nr:sugar ABC transporter permease [Jiangella alkaliphila]SDU66735.1 multiple sugar transport system permease protein [Jiangella alkaliphila]
MTTSTTQQAPPGPDRPGGAAPRGRPGRKPSPSRRKEARFAYLLLLPAILATVVLVLLPLLWNVTISLQSLRLIELRNFTPFGFLQAELSFDNFRLVTGQREFWPTVWRTVVYAFAGTVLSLLLGLWAALAMRRPFRGRGAVKALLLVPYVLPVVAAAFVWRTMLSPQYGIVNAWGQDWLGWSRVDFFGQQNIELPLVGTVPLAFSTVIAFEAWRYFPFAFIFIYARLQAVPKALYEAATIDGATISQQFRHVTFPALRGVLAVLFLLRFIWNFNDFTNIYLLTGGGAGTRVISIEIYEWLIGRSNPGAAAALSLILAAVMLVVLTVYVRWQSRRDQT